MQAQAKVESALSQQPKAASEGRYPWERQPGESTQAYARFVAYRNTPPSERSMRKLGISGQLAFRWAKRWRWTRRTALYDDWQLELGDGLAQTAQLGARLAAARLGSAFARRALRSVNEVKLSTTDDLVTLAKAGVALERQALGLSEGVTVADRAPVAQVAVSFGSAPPWLTRPTPELSETNTQVNETKRVVPVVEQVLAETTPGLRRMRLAERVVNCPKGNNYAKPNGGGTVRSRSEGKVGGR